MFNEQVSTINWPVEVAPRVNYGPRTGARLFQRDSLNRFNLLRNMIPAALQVRSRDKNYNVSAEQGNLLATRVNSTDTVVLGKYEKDQDGEILTHLYLRRCTQISGAWVVPVSPWGNEIDIMWLHTGTGGASNIDEISPHVQVDQHNQRFALMQRVIAKYGEVYQGTNISPYCLEGKGLQSVLNPHEHIWMFGESNKNRTSLEIQALRNTTEWDNGISRNIADLIRNKLTNLSSAATIDIDNLGFSLRLKGKSLSDFKELNSWRTIISPIVQQTNVVLEDLHNQLYGHTLPKIKAIIERARMDGSITDIEIARYREQFTLIDQTTTSPLLNKLRDLHITGEIRQPIGYAITSHFNENDDPMIYVTLGPKNKGMGPVEGVCIDLKRPEQESSDQEVTAKIFTIRNLMRAA